MAIHVWYFEGTPGNPIDRDRVYAEGPFVCVNAHGWRIEVDSPGCYCPVLPDVSIWKLREKLGLDTPKYNDIEQADVVCDKLNELVRSGEIRLTGRQYVWVDKETQYER